MKTVASRVLAGVLSFAALGSATGPASFERVEESKLLTHPGDDYTQMVFAPGLRGLTDQTIFKFRKPRKR